MVNKNLIRFELHAEGLITTTALHVSIPEHQVGVSIHLVHNFPHRHELLLQHFRCRSVGK